VSDVIQFALLGLCIGAMYGLSAVGLVVVFRASGVLNFAGGAMGAVAAFVFYHLRDRGMATLPDFAIALAIGGGLAGATQLFVMRPMQRSSAVAKLIATLALFSGLQGVAIAIWGTNLNIVASILPQTRVDFGGGIGLSEDRIWMLGIALLLSAVLWALYTLTRFGLATSAVAENRRAAAALGWSSNRIEIINWTIGGVLSALTAVLLAPIVGMGATALSLLVLPALAAALVGGFASFPLTLLGGAILGITESLLAAYVNVTGVSTAVPFLIIVAVIVAGGKARPTRADLPVRLPLPGPGTIRWPIVIGLVLAAQVFVLVVDPQWQDAAITTLIAAIVVLSVVVVTGFGGQLALGQWALSGVGALIAARLAAGAGWPFWAAAILGILGTIPLGLAIALPALRTRGVNLGIVTLGLALCIQTVLLSNEALTGGLGGTFVGDPSLFGLNIGETQHAGRYATLVLIVFVLLGVAVANLRRGASGRRLLAVRSNERVAASLGINVYGVKLYAFGVGSAIAATAGVLAAFRAPEVVFSQFDVNTSINSMIYAVIGGVGWVSGALAGALMVPAGVLATLIDKIGSIDTWLPVISAGLLILTLIWAPDGIAALMAALISSARARVEARARRSGDRLRGEHPLLAYGGGESSARGAQARAANLKLEGVTVEFGGVTALDNFDFVARPGEVTGLIGPNGAGKTTVLDAVSGFVKPTAGTIRVDQQSLSGWSVERRATLGLGRAFQAVELFPEMTVGENLLVASEAAGLARYITDLIVPGRPRATSLMQEVIREFGLEKHLDTRPPELPHGTARLVGIARTLVGDARVLMLDEPAAGLARHEREELSRILRRIATERDVAVVLVEHDVELVMKTCDRITVLDFGRRIAEGTPVEVEHNSAVIDAYLGTAPTGAPARGAPGPELAESVPLAHERR
jgi:sulfate-transporting ATPase